MACTRPSNTFTTLGGGVPVHYDRADPPFHYGSQGKAHTFAVQPAFETLLDGAFSELWTKCPLGKADIILSAGSFVCKPGQHGKGTAFDLDGIWWGSRLVLAKNYRTDAQAYLGIESVLRKHFGTVLNFEYNAAHQDHWHFDTGTRPGFDSASESRVKFLQMALGKLFGKAVKVDGRIGDESRGAVREVLIALGLAAAGDLDSDQKIDSALSANWPAFLDAAAAKGLATLGPPATGTAAAGASPADANPLQLLARLHELLEDELLEHPARKSIERAIQNFAEHPDIAAVLAKFE